jgi:hypothetical protein
MKGAEERREFIRVSDQFNVRLVKRESGTSTVMLEMPDSSSINVSGSGLLVNMNEKAEPGTMLNVIFMKPRTFDMFKATGRIVRVEQAADGTFNAGIHFIDLRPEEKHELNTCLVGS